MLEPHVGERAGDERCRGANLVLLRRPLVADLLVRGHRPVHHGGRLRDRKASRAVRYAVNTLTNDGEKRLVSVTRLMYLR